MALLRSSRLTDADLDRIAPAIELLLPHVPFDGWSQAAIDRAVSEAEVASNAGGVGLPPAVRLTPVHAIAAWSALLDRRLGQEMPTEMPRHERVRDKVVAATRQRLAYLADNKEAARRATVLLALPFNGFVATACLHRTVDQIWRLAGDRSTDHNWYTKRALLAGVYSTTLLYMLNDSSEKHTQTWDFLGRRIDDVMKIPGNVSAARDRLAAPFRSFSDPRSLWRDLRDLGRGGWSVRR